MNSPLLALFIRSLREDSRQRLTYVARSGLALVILFFLFASAVGGSAPGLQFFKAVIIIDMCFIVLAGVSYFASAISEEKEEMTLGLLRMTNLNSLSILLGKSTSRLMGVILLLAAQIPFTLLAITLGGIELAQVSAAYVAVASFLVLISNLALLCSVLCRRSATAGALTGMALFFFFCLVPMAGALAKLPVDMGVLLASSGWVTALDSAASFAHRASPVTRLGAIFATGFPGGAFSFQAGSNLVMSAACFLAAWALFEKCCGEQKESAPSRQGLTRSRGRWSWLSPGRAWGRALAWKDFYFMAGGKLWLIIKMLMYGAPLAAARCWPEVWDGPMAWDKCGMLLCALMGAFILAEVTVASANLFRIERQAHTLSSLAMLPQGIRRTAYDKLQGLLPSLVPAGLYLLLGFFLITRVHGVNLPEIFDSRWSIYVTVFLLSQGIFFLHLVANLSLRVRRGALPLAIGVYVLLCMFVGIGSLGMLRDEAGFILLILLTIGATVFLHLNVGHRLVELAAEE